MFLACFVSMDTFNYNKYWFLMEKFFTLIKCGRQTDICAKKSFRVKSSCLSVWIWQTFIHCFGKLILFCASVCFSSVSGLGNVWAVQHMAAFPGAQYPSGDHHLHFTARQIQGWASLHKHTLTLHILGPPIILFALYSQNIQKLCPACCCSYEEKSKCFHTDGY